MNRLYLTIALLAVAFGAGWAANGWRINSKERKQEIVTLKDEVKQRNEVIGYIDSKLKNVAQQADDAALATTEALGALKVLNDGTNRQLDIINAGTQKVQNEINSLGVPRCVYSLQYGSLYQDISKTANSGRFAVYGAQAENPD